MRDVVKSAIRVSDPQPIIVVLFHEYDFFEIDREKGKLGYQDFEKLLAWVTSQKDIRVLSIGQATTVLNDSSNARRFIKFKSYLKACYLLPPFLHPLSGVYLSSKIAYNMKIRYWMFALFFYIAVFMISITITFFGGHIVFPRSRLVTSVSKYGGPALLILLSIYALHNLTLGFKGAIVIAVLLGACIGVWISFLRLKKTRL